MTYKWSLFHYLDDLFTVFMPNSKLDGLFQAFKTILLEFSFVKAENKDEFGTLVSFLFDFNLIEVCLLPIKHIYAARVVFNLAS